MHADPRQMKMPFFPSHGNSLLTSLTFLLHSETYGSEAKGTTIQRTQIAREENVRGVNGAQILVAHHLYPQLPTQTASPCAHTDIKNPHHLHTQKIKGTQPRDTPPEKPKRHNETYPIVLLHPQPSKPTPAL